MLLQATVMRFIGARKHAARCNQTLAAKCSEISSDFLVKLHSCRATKALRNYNHWTDFLPFCRRVCSPAQSATSKKKRSATAPTWRMEDDSASPRNSDPSVVSQALPWGMTQADLKFKFCLHKYVQKVCYLTLTSVVGGKHFLFPALKSVENSN